MAATEEERAQQQQQADAWNPPNAQLRPYATVAVPGRRLQAEAGSITEADMDLLLGEAIRDHLASRGVTPASFGLLSPPTQLGLPRMQAPPPPAASMMPTPPAAATATTPPVAATTVSDEYYHNGKTYRRKRPGSNINASWSLEEIQSYVAGIRNTVESYNPSRDVLFDSIEDYVCTMRNASSTVQSKFVWPCFAISFQQAIAASLATMPPGCCLVIANGLDIPQHLLTRRKEFATSASADGSLPAEVGASVTDYYHGASPTTLLAMWDDGFRTCLGAGADQLHEHVSMAVPGVYMANNYRSALQYPMTSTSRANTGGYRGGTSGGTLLAEDGTYPMRCVIRCLASPHHQLWHSTKTKQSLFMPSSVHITHIIFQAVHPEICHQVYAQLSFGETTVTKVQKLLTLKNGRRESSVQITF